MVFKFKSCLKILYNKKAFVTCIIIAILLAVGLTFIIERYDNYDRWFEYHFINYDHLLDTLLIWLGILITSFTLTILIYFIKNSIKEPYKFYKIFCKSLKVSKYIVLIAAIPLYFIILFTIGSLIIDYPTFRLNYAVVHKNCKNHVKACEELIDNWYDNSTQYLPKEYSESSGIIKELAEYDNAKAQNMLGLSLLYSSSQPRFMGDRSPEQDMERAMYWFKRSADNGDKFAQFNLARFYLGHHLDYRMDKEKAIQYLKLSAKNGFGLAHYYLGNIYKNNGFVKEANKHFIAGAKLGDDNCKAVNENIDFLN